MRRYILLALTIFAVLSAQAQEVVDDQLIYNRVTGFMETTESLDDNKVTSKNIQDIRFKHDLRITYGAPGFLSWYLLDEIGFGCGCDVGPNFIGDMNSLREKRGPKYILSTVGLSYGQQLRPWLSLGGKATFAGTWQNIYDTYTNKKLYHDRMFNIAAMLDARFSYLRRDKVELYSAISAGLVCHLERAGGGLGPMFDVVLFGASFGRTFYGFVEVGAGIGGSARVGLGYRFNSKK